ncbi:hypothetical protein SCHPADRAFT_944602 [Schizopora paradoxa]|uniref:Zn(2)-C6 fungal-type domain-containing protein n=1 Tax=Schizopora paradoxa TaxID=27342 RepID=A0A0H2R8W1_9AGAM|nr:hypothetical protein SCHPADRAFT_944602 [Schizopora paradoxa]
MFSTKNLLAAVPCPDQKKCRRPHCPLGHTPNAGHVGLPHIPSSTPISSSKPVPTASSSTSSGAPSGSKSILRASNSSILSKRPEAPSPEPGSSRSGSNQTGDSPNKRLKTTVSCTECKRAKLICDGRHPCRPCQSRNAGPLCKYIPESANLRPQPGISNTRNPVTLIRSTGSALNVPKPVPVSSVSKSSTGCPILRINAALSQVAIPVRQAMVKNLYQAFSDLYEDLLKANPELPSDHALAQEVEIYEKSNKITYRSAAILCIASIKRRPKPHNISHDSVGTEGMRQKRRDEYDRLRALTLTRKHLEQHILSLEEMKLWGYIVEIPEGPGGDRPSDEGKTRDCERCGKVFEVKRKEDAEECVFHWGRPFTSRTNGERARVYNCCGQPVSTSDGCSRGPHVFYESSPGDLHARQPFTMSRSLLEGGSDTALDVLALDCEMIYSTAGISCARVSVVDGCGGKVLDELVRMDDGVEVIDFNTRFSGVTDENYATAVLDLKAIRRSLDAFINTQTIIIGHALDNDLKTLRMIHHRCVDTTALYPHRSGPPFRKKLRDLAREILDRKIQTGDGNAGHSSLEDSVATLDLVRQFVIENKSRPAKPKPSVPPPTPQSTTPLPTKT